MKTQDFFTNTTNNSTYRGQKRGLGVGVPPSLRSSPPAGDSKTSVDRVVGCRRAKNKVSGLPFAFTWLCQVLGLHACEPPRLRRVYSSRVRPYSCLAGVSAYLQVDSSQYSL